MWNKNYPNVFYVECSNGHKTIIYSKLRENQKCGAVIWGAGRLPCKKIARLREINQTETIGGSDGV